MSKNKEGATSRIKGQSLVEFALVVLVLVLVFMGVFDLGYAAYAYNTIALAAREGARYGIICTHSQASIQAQAEATAVGLNLTSANVLVTPDQPNHLNSNLGACPGGLSRHGSLVTVTVVYTYTPATIMIVQALGANNIALSAHSTMIVQ